MKHKKLFISLTAVLSVILFLAVFLFTWYLLDFYPDFNKDFRKEFEIPGLDDGAVPQGFSTCSATHETTDADGKKTSETRQYYFISAYMVDGSPSRLYVTGDKEGYIGYVTMKDLTGNEIKGHCGGVAINGSTLWVADGKTVYVAKASAEYKSKNIAREIIEKAAYSQNPVVENDDGTTETKEFNISFTSSFNANCNASFLFYYDDSRYSSVTYDRLYVGEFYRKGNYETHETRHLKTPGGYKNTAFMYEYNVSSSSDNKYGLVTLSDDTLDEESKVPKIQKIFSLPEQIQGVAFSRRKGYGTNDGMLVLSQSYGLKNSHLLCFDWAKVTANANAVSYTNLHEDSFAYEGIFKKVGDKQIKYTDNSLKVYYVDKGNKDMFVNDYSIPSMSEGMCVFTPPKANDTASVRIYVLFESAGKKYNKFVRERLENVYSFIPHEK